MVSGIQTGKNQCPVNMTEILKGYTFNGLYYRVYIGIHMNYHHGGGDEITGKVENHILI